MNIVFIGAGKMATAIAGGIVRGKVFPYDNVYAYDVSEASRTAFKQSTGIECADSPNEIVPKADVIILAVKPQVAEAAVADLPQRKDNVLVVSICAGIGISKLRQWFATSRIVRVMPNTPLMVGMGASCYVMGTASDESGSAFVEKLLGTLGGVWCVHEDQMDAITALSGSGPAYFFEFIEAMKQAGMKLGLSEELALELAVQTMAGSTEMLKKKMGTPEELRIAVTSPGGTTAAALDVMNKAKFRQMVEDLMSAAATRSAELGK